jgi:GDP-D-mannose dehydratase
MRSALIIGAGGQDGRLLAPLLLDRRYAVRGSPSVNFAEMVARLVNEAARTYETI